MRILALSRRLPPEGGRQGERNWRVVLRLAAMAGTQVVWVAPCGRPWSRRVVAGGDREMAVDIRYVAAGPWPWLEPVSFLPGLVREGAKVVKEAELLLLPRGDWLLEASLLGLAPACPVQRWDPEDPDGDWPLCPAQQGA